MDNMNQILPQNQWVQLDFSQNRWVQLHPLTHSNEVSGIGINPGLNAVITLAPEASK